MRQTATACANELLGRKLFHGMCAAADDVDDSSIIINVRSSPGEPETVRRRLPRIEFVI